MSVYKPNMTPMERLLFWVEVVARPVADRGPANDEWCRVEARDLYNLTQAAAVLRESEEK